MTKIFIAGQMRSGTTLLSNVLSAHEDIIIFPDFLHIDRLKKYASIKDINSPLTKEQKFLILAKFYSSSDGIKIIEETYNYSFEIKISVNEFETLTDFYNLVLDTIAKKTKKTHIGHKTTNAESILKEIIISVPNLKVIYIYRDPKDVFLSFVRRGLFSTTKPEILQHWKTGYLEIKDLKRKSDSNNLLIIKFEDLINKHEEQLNEICNFLKISPFPKNLQNINHYSQNFNDNSSFSDITTLFDKKAIGRWKNAPEKNEILTLTNKFIGKNLIEQAGFEYIDISPTYKFFYFSKLFFHKVLNRIKRYIICIIRR